LKNQDKSFPEHHWNNNGRATLIAIGGLSGSGKSTLARGIAKQILNPNTSDHIILLSNDDIRKELWGVSKTTRLPSEAYTWEATTKVIKASHQRAGLALKANKIVILDSIFNSDTSRTDQEKLAKKHNAAFFGFFLNCDTDVLLERVKKRALENKDASDAGPDIVMKQLEGHSNDTCWHKIASNRAIDDILFDVLDILKKPS